MKTKNIIVLLLCAGLFSLGFVSNASALIVLDSVNLDQIGTNIVYDGFSFVHAVNFDEHGIDPLTQVLSEGEVQIKHSGVGDDSGELWYVFNSSNVQIGQLSNSTAGAVWDTFTLPEAVLNEMLENDKWRLEIVLKEMSDGVDGAGIHYSQLLGSVVDASQKVVDIIPNPEPVTMFMFASGLLGLFGLRRKFNQ